MLQHPKKNATNSYVLLHNALPQSHLTRSRLHLLQVLGGIAKTIRYPKDGAIENPRRATAVMVTEITVTLPVPKRLTNIWVKRLEIIVPRAMIMAIKPP